MNELQPPLISTPVSFTLHADKQRRLIRILMKCGKLTIPDLSYLLNISQKKLTLVLIEKGFLNESEAKELVDYFCIFCTN